jgi:hypothetical protein
MPANSAPESAVSSISWSAVIAGALTAWAVTLVVLTAGAAFGFSVLSPYDNSSTLSATGFQVATGVFTLITAVVASTFGGYVAGRLRTRWVDVHTDEVYFRDTAHGFLAWALATLLGALMIALSATSVASGSASNPANGPSMTMTRSATAPATARSTSMTASEQEAARKAAIQISLWLTASLLAGAFTGSAAATWGGDLRDRGSRG